MKKRIWELDALRGLGLLVMIAIHIAYDLIVLYRIWQPESTALLAFGQRWGGVIFLVLSGICVTLGTKPVRRGLQVFGCGLLISAVTGMMYLLDFCDASIIIYFGVLHCLGVCMLLWPVFRKSPPWLLAVLGTVLTAVGLYWKFTNAQTDTWLFTPFGVPSHTFASSDYFPLLPNLGYFLLGAFVGKTVYKNKESVLPNADPRNPIIRFLCLCGKHSLLIYLVHQPLIAAAIALIAPLL